MVKHLPRMAGAVLLAALCACGGGNSNPLSSTEKQLIGTWKLDLSPVATQDFGFSYTFANDRTVRNRMGGALLERLRDLPALEGADLGRLGGSDEISGATVTWRGTWRVAGDSLHVVYDHLQVEVVGNLPGVGAIAVPVHDVTLTAAQRATITYTYDVTASRLVLRGAAATAGVGTHGVPALGPLGSGALRAASDVLLETYASSDANEFVYTR